MNRNADWLRYLRMLLNTADHGSHGPNGHVSQEALLADHWAHDPRCVRVGVQHRRVGAEPHGYGHGHGQWLEAGVTAHLRTHSRTGR